MEFNKVTVGFVVQHFVEGPNGKSICDKQEFVAGDDCSYEDAETGEILSDLPDYKYQPYDMVQRSFNCHYCGIEAEGESFSIGEIEFCSEKCLCTWKASNENYE